MKISKPTFEFEDQKGYFKEIIQGEWKAMNLAMRKKGTTSADHYHAHTTECFYVVYGDCDFIITDVKTGLETRHRVKQNQIFIVDKMENVKIYYREDTLFVMLKDQYYDKNNPDIHRINKKE